MLARQFSFSPDFGILNLQQKLVEILEFLIHAGETDISDLVDNPQTLHDGIAQTLRGDFPVEFAEKLFLDLEHELGFDLGGDRSLGTGCLNPLQNSLRIKCLT